MLLRRHLLQGLCMLHLHGGDSLSPVYTIQPVVKPVVKPVGQPGKCLYTRYSRLSNKNFLHGMLFRDIYQAFICVLLYFHHHFTVFVVNFFYLTLYCIPCCYGLRLSNLIKETTYLENLHAKTIYQYIHATYCKKQVTEQA